MRFLFEKHQLKSGDNGGHIACPFRIEARLPLLPFETDVPYTETLLMVRLGIAGLKLPPIGIPKA